MTRPSTWRDEADDHRDILARLKRLEMAAFGSQPVSSQATLPVAPNDGREFSYALEGGGKWRFDYNALAGVWDFAGGTPIVSIPSIASWTGRSTSTYQTLTNESGVDAPSITVPFSGLYLVRFSGLSLSDINGTTCYMGLSVGGAAPDADADIATVMAASNQAIPFSRDVPPVTLAADDVLTLKGKGSGSGWGFFSRLALIATPIYVTS